MLSYDLKFFNWIADVNFAAFDDAAQHSTPAVDLAAQAGTHLFQLIAGSTNGADFEQRGSDAEALTDRESVDVEAVGRDVFANDSRLEVHRVERFAVNEENLAFAGCAGVSAAGETAICNNRGRT